MELAKQHVGTVTAILNAVNAYAEWAPVTDLAKYGLIYGSAGLNFCPKFGWHSFPFISQAISFCRCGPLLSYGDFRLHACEFFKVICQRYRETDVFF